MKKIILLIFPMIIYNSFLFASDEWRVFGPYFEEKTKYSSPPFAKWHNDAIKYKIASSPPNLSYLIDESFDTWEDIGLYNFSKVSSGHDIIIETVDGPNSWFGYGPPTINNSTGEITSALIQLNVGTYPYEGKSRKLVWTDGNEDVNEDNMIWYLDVQNCVTHEIGHNLGIAHHSTGNGEPTMATRSQCPSFNYTLKRRTLETDDEEALEFLDKNLYVPSEFFTINSAINTSFFGGTVYVASGTYTENNNLTVSSGVILDLNPGVTLNIASGKKLAVNGTLIAYGTSSQDITFRSSSGTWYGIEANYGECYLKYCTLQNSQNAVKAYHSQLQVEHSSITSSSTGIRYDNQSTGYVRNCTISSCSSYGIHCSQNSDPAIRPYNRIWGNTTGVYGDYNSLPVLGTYGNYGNNSIKNNWIMAVWSENINTVYALYNYWGSSSPDPEVSDNVAWDPYLNSDPTGGGLLKPLAENASTVPDNGDVNTDTSGRSKFAKAYQIYLSGNFIDALPLFEALVNKYPETPAGLQALSLTDYCYQNLDNPAASLSYLNQVRDIYTGKKISGLARSIAVGHLVKREDYDEAISNSQHVLRAYADKDLAKYALYDLGTIYWYYLNDPKTGESYYRRLIETYPEDDLAISALSTLGEWIPQEPEEEPLPKFQDVAQATPNDYAISQNYPNPFNPTTEIRYQLPEASRVILSIYDATGRKVAELVNQQVPAGYHQATWNASNLPSGVYFFKLQADNFIATRKLLLLK